jgi:hypothetical protein
MRGFGPIRRDDRGRLSAEHHETGWVIAARRKHTLQRMAALVRRAAWLARDGGGR